MTDTTDVERELRAALADAHAKAPEPHGLEDRLVAAATSDPSTPHRRRVRPSRRWLPPLAAAAAVLALVVGIDAVVTSLRDDGSRPAAKNPGLTTPLIAPKSLLDVRELGFHLAPAPGFEMIDYWWLGRDRQATRVRLDGGVDLWVNVYYEGTAPFGTPPGREAVSVNGRAGRYSEEMHSGDGKVPGYWSASVIWEYAPDSFAEVSGQGYAAAPADLREKILTVAEAVRPGGKDARLPFRVGDWPVSLPSLATADAVSQRPLDEGVVVSFGELSLSVTTGHVDSYCVDNNGDNPAGTKEFTYRGHRGCIPIESSGAVETVYLYVGDTIRSIDIGGHQVLPIEDVKRVLAEITMAPSDEPATWFDLKTALGG
jgi:hypothetical protein